MGIILSIILSIISIIIIISIILSTLQTLTYLFHITFFMDKETEAKRG